MSSLYERVTWFLTALWCRQRGQGLTEYGLILVICSIVAIVLIQSIGPKVAQMFSTAGSSLK